MLLKTVVFQRREQKLMCFTQEEKLFSQSLLQNKNVSLRGLTGMIMSKARALNTGQVTDPNLLRNTVS